MEGSERILRHFKKPDKNQNRQHSAEDYEGIHEQSEHPSEFYRGRDDRTLSTNRMKEFSKNLELKKPFSEPSSPSHASGETREDDLLGFEVGGNETGARDDRAVETDTMEKHLENVPLLEEKKSGGEKKTWRKKKSWDKKKTWRKKRSGDEKKSEDKKSGDGTLPLSSENLNLLEKKKSGGEKDSGETGARNDRAIETDTMDKHLENVPLLEEKKKSEGGKKSWRKRSWRKKRNGDKEKSEDKNSGDRILPLSSKNLRLLEKKSGGEKESGGETSARVDRAIETDMMEDDLEHLRELEEENRSWHKSWNRKRWRQRRSGGNKQKIEGIVWPDSPGSPGAKRLPILLRGESEPRRTREGEEGGPSEPERKREGEEGAPSG